jgi:hypothetical protein
MWRDRNAAIVRAATLVEVSNVGDSGTCGVRRWVCVCAATSLHWCLIKIYESLVDEM